ncbi:c-type cytochrome [Rhodobaculum claviforme]|uniref:c-type cytochrome n=1 Tax=Rhodobaculum claviforme TaxID=1549854 RepID=UPI001911C330|nr:c-type cytochrome [Rhodobaculum claviforme]
MFDTMVFTKALGALCGAALIFLLGSWVSNSIFVSGSRDLPPAFSMDLGGDDDADADGAEAPVQLSVAEAFQMADAGAGARVWNQCRACHVADEARNNVGPYLLNVVGRDIGAVDGFRYSGALPEGERWTVENLYAFLENPRGWAQGTSMAFNGLGNQMDRVNVIAYLIDNSPDFDPATDAPALEEAAVDAATEEDVAEAPADAATEEDVADAPADVATEEEVVEAPAEEMTEEQAAEAPAPDATEEEAVAAASDAAREEDVTEATAEDATEEEVADAPAEDATEEDVAEAPAESATEEEVAEAPAEAATEEQVADAPAEDAREEDVAEAPAEEAPAEEMSAFAQMVADGDVRAGSRVWNQCRACHVADVEQNRVGPHLVGIIGRQSNSIEGFRYSGNLPDVVWTKDELNEYLENPRGYAPGTSMVFNGLRNIEDRANVLAYIESIQ